MSPVSVMIWLSLEETGSVTGGERSSGNSTVVYGGTRVSHYSKKSSGRSLFLRLKGIVNPINTCLINIFKFQLHRQYQKSKYTIKLDLALLVTLDNCNALFFKFVHSAQIYIIN